jgi:hypothetical protein
MTKRTRGMFPEELECVDWIVERLTERQISALHDLMAFDTDATEFTAAEIGISPQMLRSLHDFGRDERGCAFPLMLTRCKEDMSPKVWSISPLGAECLGVVLSRTSEAL